MQRDHQNVGAFWILFSTYHVRFSGGVLRWLFCIGYHLLVFDAWLSTCIAFSKTEKDRKNQHRMLGISWSTSKVPYLFIGYRMSRIANTTLCSYALRSCYSGQKTITTHNTMYYCWTGICQSTQLHIGLFVDKEVQHNHVYILVWYLRVS